MRVSEYVGRYALLGTLHKKETRKSKFRALIELKFIHLILFAKMFVPVKGR